ncbi:MAG: dTDP-4-dehydrorhamnose reductase [Flavobacterium sp.]
MVVLVTGSSGQLGQSLQFIASGYPEIDFRFCDSSVLDITKGEECEHVFNQIKPDFCINAAAYTAVDKAESEPEKAYSINVIGPKNLANICKKTGTTLIHISTDFVFDGKKHSPYTEIDATSPQSVYGRTKLQGEIIVQETIKNYYIIRTSWVYSPFGNNFMKTMLRLANERDSLNVVNDQTGTPTNAIDLAKVLIKIILTKESANNFGIYNYSNEGECSWYDFAKKIFEIHTIKINLNPIPTTNFPTPAKRPIYSVLDKTKIKNVFGVEIKNWEECLIANGL